MILTFQQPLPDGDPSDTLRRAREALVGLGFAPSPASSSAPGLAPGEAAPQASSPVQLRLARGSLWWNLLGFRMDRLRQQLDLTLARDPDAGLQLTLRYDVHTVGQYVTEGERRYFEEEATALADELAGRPDPRSRLAAYRRRAVQRTLLTLAVAALLGVGLRAALYYLNWI